MKILLFVIVVLLYGCTIEVPVGPVSLAIPEPEIGNQGFAGFTSISQFSYKH